MVAHRDRLCRFGIELVEQLFRKAGTRLVVHEHAHDVLDHPDRTAELAEDLIAITTAFVARHHGQRSAANRRERKRKRDRDEQEGGSGGGAEGEAGAEESADASGAGGGGDGSASAERPAKRRADAQGAARADLPVA